MANNAKTTAPGLTPPAKIGMIGATPAQSAHQETMNTGAKAQNLKNAVGGNKKKKHWSFERN